MICAVQLPAELIATRNFAVLGLGLSGMAALARLIEAGASIIAWDDQPSSRQHAAARYGSTFIAAAAQAIDWSKITDVIVSPGIPLSYPQPHPLIKAARAAGCRLINDVILWNQARKHRDQIEQTHSTVIAVTGANGKSTVTGLIDHLLRRLGFASTVAGNIGVPILDLDLDAAPSCDRVYVVELSSYQLELIDQPIADIAIILNISPDHLDRYANMADYAAAKERLVAEPSLLTAIIGDDDPWCRAIAERSIRKAKKLIRLDKDQMAATALSKPPARLRGDHNQRNYAAAIAAIQALTDEHRDVPVLDGYRDALALAAQDYPGLAHRQHMIASRPGIIFIDDSKATNPHAAAAALQSFEAIYWVAGGQAKNTAFTFSNTELSSVRKGYFYGEAADPLRQATSKQISAQCYQSFADAVSDATRDAVAARQKTQANSSVTVLLSPACASFDQFDDYRARGHCFQTLIHRLTAALNDPAPRSPESVA